MNAIYLKLYIDIIKIKKILYQRRIDMILKHIYNT